VVVSVRLKNSLPFSPPLLQFQRRFPDEAACEAYLEQCRWPGGFTCTHCGTNREPYRFKKRPGVLRCRKCRKDTRLTAGTVMADSRTPLLIWFWSAHLVSTQTDGMSATQLRRQLGIPSYETAYNILQKLRAAMVRPNRDRIGAGRPGMDDYVEADEAWFDSKGLVTIMGAIEVRWVKNQAGVKSAAQRYGGRLRLAVGNRTKKAFEGFIQGALVPGAPLITDDSPNYGGLGKLGYAHEVETIHGSKYAAGFYLKFIHLIFGNLRTWLNGTHHGIRACHLQAYLNEFTFRFNRRFYPLGAVGTLLGIASSTTGPTYEGLYSGTWKHPSCG